MKQWKKEILFISFFIAFSLYYIFFYQQENVICKKNMIFKNLLASQIK